MKEWSMAILSGSLIVLQKWQNNQRNTWCHQSEGLNIHSLLFNERKPGNECVSVSACSCEQTRVLVMQSIPAVTGLVSLWVSKLSGSSDRWFKLLLLFWARNRRPKHERFQISVQNRFPTEATSPHQQGQLLFVITLRYFSHGCEKSYQIAKTTN